MVLPHRPLEPLELVHPPKMGRYIRRILLHLHLTYGLLNDSASAQQDVQRPRHNFRDRNPTGPLHFRASLCYRSTLAWTALRSLREGICSAAE